MAFSSADQVLSEEQALLALNEVAQKPPYRRSLVAALALSAALLLVGVVAVSTSASTTATANSKPTASLLSLSEQEATCAKKDEENCYESKCCKDLGYQCYEKQEGWAVCKQQCDAEEMVKYDPKNETWSCEPRGERNRCAKDGEDCAPHGCCEAPGAQCYKKNKDWSMCFETCDSAEMKKNDPEKEDWSCDAIGERNFKSKCAWAGEDCGAAGCCNNIGFTCAVKDETYTGCTQTIKKTTWVTKAIPIPADWEGTVLGQGRGEYQVNAVPEGGEIAGTSLFCFMVYLPDSDEESLMWLAKKNGVSIFGCDKYITLHAWQSGAGGWDTGETTLINTDVFTVAFDSVREDGEYLKHDWTVKVDPDCVFFADRLRSHLSGIRAPPYTPMYIKNNDMDPGLGNNGFLGAVEIFSTIAMQTYFANAEGCKKSLGSNSGEDGFFKGCMDALGVGFMLDGNVFAPDFDPQSCTKGERVAFHPIKAYDSWQACVDIVMGVPRLCPFAKCDDGSDIERPWMVQLEGAAEE